VPAQDGCSVSRNEHALVDPALTNATEPDESIVLDPLACSESLRSDGVADL
jgi:hypothetical protein